MAARDVLAAAEGSLPQSCGEWEPQQACGLHLAEVKGLVLPALPWSCACHHEQPRCGPQVQHQSKDLPLLGPLRLLPAHAAPSGKSCLV